jgi:nucleotide-binding universal stress UspA family protein
MVELKNILCPLDMSLEGDVALRYAIALARAYEANLSLCHCVDEFPSETPAQRAEVSEQFRNAVTAAAQARLDAPTLGRIEGLVVQGDPRKELLRVAAQRNIDLIVMRARRRPVAAALLGSTTEAVCRSASCSVLVTHSDERTWEGLDASEIHLHRILVASDFSPGAESAFHFGVSLAQEYQAELTLLHVLAPAPAFALAMSDAVLNDVNELHRARLRLRAAVPAEAYLWCSVEEVVREGAAHREILHYAQAHPIDLICLGAHGADATVGTLFGTNTERVLRHALCPVLIARPPTAVSLDAPIHIFAQRLW